MESMLDKGNKKHDSDATGLALKETVVETPPMGMSQVTSEAEQVMFDASIRTDRTLLLGK